MAGGRRGPAPEPASVKRAKGNSGRRPNKAEKIEQEANKALENTGGSSEIQPPEWLNEEGRKVWADLAPRLAAMKILQSIDAQTFGRYCQDFGRWVQLQRILDTEGATYESESPHGTYKRAHPAFMQADRLDRACLAHEANFALNPADRQRLFAARAAAANSPGLFDQPGNDAGKNKGDKPSSPIGLLN